MNNVIEHKKKNGINKSYLCNFFKIGPTYLMQVYINKYEKN